MDYLDFDLGLRLDDSGVLRVRVLSSPAGTTESQPVDVDLHAIERESRRLLQANAARRHLFEIHEEAVTKVPIRTPDEVGASLFQIAFPESVRRLLDESRGHADGLNSGLRLRLHFDLGNRRQRLLVGIPWELTLRPQSPMPLGLDRNQPMARVPEIPRSELTPPLPYPLHIAVLVSQPPEAPPLDLKREQRQLEEVWGKHSEVSVRVLRATSENLRIATLEEAHVIHFMGHGLVNDDEGALVFEDLDGNAELKSAQVLARLLNTSKNTRLVVLNACSSGELPTSGACSGFQSVAPALVRAGVPAVVAMTAPIADFAALTFSGALYRRLAVGDAVDVAVTEGRLAIYADHDSSCEWAVPALYLSREEPQLFVTREAARIQPEARRRFDQGWAAFGRGDYPNARRHFLEACEKQGDYPLAELHACIAVLAMDPPSCLSPTLADDLERRLDRLIDAEESEVATLAAGVLLLLRSDYHEAKHLRPLGRPTAALLSLLEGHTPSTKQQRLLRCIPATKTAQAEAGLKVLPSHERS